MNIIVKPPIPDPPYSLHDAHILSLELEGDALRLVTQYGYVCTTEPYGQVDGDVELTGVDADFSYVYVLEYTDVLCGNCGHFTGRKMTLEAFLAAYAEAPLEILDESYGYRSAKLSGFLDVGERLAECILDLWYTGEFRYLLKDLPDDLKEEGAMALAAALLKFFVASYLFNDLYELVAGRRPAFDPIDMVNELIGDTAGYQLPNTFEEIGKAASGTASGEDFTTEHKGVAKAVAGLGGSIAEQTPFVGGVMGGGRLPLQSAVPDIWQMGRSLA